jgi:hypothetical protein
MTLTFFYDTKTFTLTSQGTLNSNIDPTKYGPPTSEKRTIAKNANILDSK